MKATAEYATAKIAVWWDMKDCPIPEGYDSCRIRKILEGAFEEQGYSGPVSITAYGDQTETPGYILQGLFSTGVSVAHTRSESKNHLMYRDMVEWRGQNAPPATMMIISDLVAKGNQFSWDLVRQQQRTLYNLFLAYSVRPQGLNNVLSTSEEWCRNKLLKNKLSGPLVVVQGAKFYCKSCNFDSQSPEKFRKHLSSYKHAREEDVNPGFEKVRRYTEDWRRNYKATPEFATAKIQVLWDMFDCPIPEGYDARQVRPSIEAAFKDLGYSGPVSITAYGYHKHTPLQALSSTGVDVVHTVPGLTKCHSCSLLQSGSEKAYLQVQRKEDHFFRSAAVKVKAVNLPQCFIANCAKFFFFFFLFLNGKYHFINELLKLTICDKQTIRPLKNILPWQKKVKTWKQNQSNLKPFCFGANKTSNIDTNL
ncbi:unnamed protein product [Brassica napus]|nr:unnamed protein product [Brassica napus]